MGGLLQSYKVIGNSLSWEGTKFGKQQSTCCDRCLAGLDCIFSPTEENISQSVVSSTTDGLYLLISHNCPPQTSQNDFDHQERQSAFLASRSLGKGRSIMAVSWKPQVCTPVRGKKKEDGRSLKDCRSRDSRNPCFRRTWSITKCWLKLEQRANSSLLPLFLFRQTDLRNAVAFVYCASVGRYSQLSESPALQSDLSRGIVSGGDDRAMPGINDDEAPDHVSRKSKQDSAKAIGTMTQVSSILF